MNALSIVRRYAPAIVLSGAAAMLVWLPRTSLVYLLAAVVTPTLFLVISGKASANSRDERRRLIEIMPGFAWFANPEGLVEEINTNAANYTGKPIDDLRQRGWAEALHPDDAFAIQDTWIRSLQTGVPYDSESRFRRHDGSYRWFRNAAQPIRNRAGKIVRWYGLAVDIDDRKRAEEALLSSARDLRATLDSIPGMISTANAQGESDYANQRLLDYLGIELTDATNLGMVAVIHPDEREAARGEWLRCAQTGDTYDHTSRMRRFDGEYRWFRALMEPRLDQHGRIERWYGLMVDVNDQKYAEDAVRASERQLRLLFETLPIEIWCAGPDGEVTYVNQRMAHYAGLDMDNAAAAKYAIVYPEDVPRVAQHWMHSVNTGESFSCLLRIRRHDGVYRWCQTFSEPLRDDSGRVIQWYGLQIDVEEQKCMEGALRIMRSHLAHAAQLATVAELSATIAHEINQPLAAVVANGYACQRWLAAANPNLERARLTAERIVRDGNAAADVVDRVRALFKRTPVYPTLLCINEVIAEVRQLILDEVGNKNIDIQIDLGEGLPQVPADRVQMQQVIVNLIRNGVEAMASTGEERKVLIVRSRQDDSRHMRIDVCDHGSGIADTDSIFEPFFTTKKAGMGMGLAICRSIVEAHRGQLWAKVNPDRGTTFSFTLPLEHTPPEQAETEPPSPVS